MGEGTFFESITRGFEPLFKEIHERNQEENLRNFQRSQVSPSFHSQFCLTFSFSLVAISEFTRDCEAIKFKYNDLFGQCDSLQGNIRQLEENLTKLNSFEFGLRSHLSQIHEFKKQISSDLSSAQSHWKEREETYNYKFQSIEQIATNNGEDIDKVTERLKGLQRDVEALALAVRNGRRDNVTPDSSVSRKRKERDSFDSPPSSSTKRPCVTSFTPDVDRYSVTPMHYHLHNHPILSSLHPQTPRDLLIHYTLMTWKCAESDIVFPQEVDHLNWEFHLRQLKKKRAAKK